jgi:hypothetical protein
MPSFLACLSLMATCTIVLKQGFQLFLPFLRAFLCMTKKGLCVYAYKHVKQKTS